MSSTSQQIGDANKLAARIDAGEQVNPVTDDKPLSQGTQQPDIPADATVGGMNRENMAVVGDKEAVAVVQDREIAPVVGIDTELNLAEQFKDPTSRAEDKTAVPDSQMTTAEKNTQLPDSNVPTDAPSDATLDNTSAAKQTKVPEDINVDDNKDAENQDKTDIGDEDGCGVQGVDIDADEAAATTDF